MENDNPHQIILDIPHGIQMTYKTIPSGDLGHLISIEGKIQLTPNRLYKLPITNKNINLDDFYVFKPLGKISEKLYVVNIEKGMMICYVYFNCIFENDQLIGNLI